MRVFMFLGLRYKVAFVECCGAMYVEDCLSICNPETKDQQYQSESGIIFSSKGGKTSKEVVNNNKTLYLENSPPAQLSRPVCPDPKHIYVLLFTGKVHIYQVVSHLSPEPAPNQMP